MLNKINISPARQKLIIYIILGIAILAIYWQVTQYGFINLDDDDYVRKNRHIRLGIEGIRWAFFSVYAQFWHPFTWLSLMIDYKLYGPNAGGYHLTNIILHTLSTLLLFRLLNRMTGAIWKSAFIAALFALHPLRVESVAWISERKDVLSAFFWMLTLSLYVYYTEKPNIKRYVLTLVSYALALMSKPMVVTLPVIMILLDYWPLSRCRIGCRIGIESQRGNLFLWQLKEKTPFFVLSAIFSIMTIYNQFKPSGDAFPFSSRIANSFVSFITYPIKILWPHDLTISYPFRFEIPAWQVLGAVLLTVLISTAVIVTAKRFQYLFVGWMWYVITIMPVIGIIQNGDYGMADRYTYLPSIGISIMLIWGLHSLMKSKKFLFVAGIAVLTIMAVLSWNQCGYWKNSVNLFNHALSVTRNNFLAHNDLGLALYEKGKFEEAIRHYNEAVLIAPRYAYAYHNRGVAYAKLGRYQNVFADFNTAIRLKPNYAIAYNNRAYAHFLQGNKEFGCHDAQKACSMKICTTLKMYQSKGYCQ